MDPLYIQNLRYKLQKRVSRLNSVDDGDLFIITLAQFFLFIDQQPTFTGVIDTLISIFPDIDETADKIINENKDLFGGSEEESAAIGYKVLLQLKDKPDKLFNTGYAYRQVNNIHESIEAIRETFLEPLYEYLDESLDDRRAMLALLMRYKHRSEWFHRKELEELSKIERGGERALALDLYSYLYDQGIDFFIEPSSITGEVDLIAAQDTDDPVILDAKVFDGESRGKSYIRKGFNQIYTYTQQYNKPFGYLIIYKICEKDVRFALKESGNIPLVVHNHKTIFLITIDIFPHTKPVSQRPPMKAIEITEGELVTIEPTD
jgi:hypothetical protein